MASVFKRTGDRNRKGSSWYIAYVDADGVRRTVKGCSDRSTTERMAHKLEADAALQKAGLIDPRDVAFRDADWAEGSPLFRLPEYESARMICADLKAVGIEYETPEGMADFHSLRGYFVSQLVRSGASIKAVQTLARHSTPVTTLGHYAKVGVLEVAGAVEALPDPAKTPEKPAREPMAATGTEGRIRMRRHSARGAS